MKLKFAIISALAVAGGAEAQVGHYPDRSPYHDLDRKHEFTLVVGNFNPSTDPVGVAPQAGPVTGFQYQWRGTTALHLGGGLSRIAARRTIINPVLAPDSREVETRGWPLYALDGIVAVSLTGSKSWHRLVPMVSSGVGIISDLKGPDVGNFKFGTRFAFLMGAGVRWVPGGSFQLRADLTDRMHSIAYPESYYAQIEDRPPVLSRSTATSRWMHNPTVTIGLTYFARK